VPVSISGLNKASAACAALIIIKQLDNNTLIAKTSSCGYTPRF